MSAFVRSRQTPRFDPSTLITVGAVLLAIPLGLAVAISAPLAIGAMIAALYGALALWRPALAVAIWVPAFFVPFFPPGNALLRIGFAVALIAIVVALRRGTAQLAFDLHRGMLVRIALLLGWLGLTALWASDGSLVVSELWLYALATFAFLAILFTCTEREHVMLLIGGLVAGATGSAALGLFGDEIGLDPRSFAAGETHGRLAGGAGDANQLAAGLVPAIALALGLAIAARGMIARLVAVATVPLAMIGIAASESRGGFVAALVLVVLMFALVRGARGTIMTGVVLAAISGAIYFAANPSSWDRITDADSDGTGRSELWQVALQMTGDHPLGAGLNNFRALARDYALTVGDLEHVNLIVERPVVAHNTFLQFLAETGVIGLGLFLLVVIASFAASFRAARLFDATGDARMAVLARTAVCALGSFLVAAFFVSFGSGYRLWALLAIGPILLTVAERRVSARWSERRE